MNKKEFNSTFLRERLGAMPSPWDIRHYRADMATDWEVDQYPETFTDLKVYTPEPFPDQGNVGTCGGWGGSINVEILNTLYKQTYGKPLLYTDVDLSAGWLYYYSRKYTNIPDWMEGTTALGVMKALTKIGVVTEAMCPTDVTKPFTPCEHINSEEMKATALKFGALSYWNVNPNPNDIKKAIYTGGPGGGPSPIVACYKVRTSFREAYSDGIVPNPKPGEALLGGHLSTLIGWTVIDGCEYWVNLNSWGEDVGDAGYFYIRTDYPDFYPNDFWLIRHGAIEKEPKPWYCRIPILNWFFSECRE